MRKIFGILIAFVISLLFTIHFVFAITEYEQYIFEERMSILKIAVTILFGVILFFYTPTIYRGFRRSFRRKKLLTRIDEWKANGRSMSEIKDLLIRLGYHTRHVRDAMERYPKYSQSTFIGKSFVLIPRFIKDSESYKKKKRIMKIVKDAIKNNRKKEEVVDDLVNSGIRADAAWRILDRYGFFKK